MNTKVQCIPLTDFIHGDIKARTGRVIEPLLDESLAGELERAGLVRIKLVAAPLLKAAPPGNLLAAGTVQPSSASPAAPVLPKRTVITLKHGAKGPPTVA